MRPVNTTERNMPLSPNHKPAPSARVSRYHLTPESRALIAQHAAGIRTNLHWRRALRQAQDAVQSTRRAALGLLQAEVIALRHDATPTGPQA